MTLTMMAFLLCYAYIVPCGGVGETKNCNKGDTWLCLQALLYIQAFVLICV
jgi:hypothetical protein